MSDIPEHPTRIKCLVWDLDQTLWSGILLEGDSVVLRSGVREAITALDERGILQSIASQNEPKLALKQLQTWALDAFFIHPQMSLEADKPSQISRIAALLNLQLNHVAFIDDDPSQRAYVTYALPEVTVLQADQVPELAHMPIFTVERLTEEGRRRREFYLADIQRQAAERDWEGTRLAFLRQSQIVLTLRPALSQDGPRIVELIERTNQLNTAAHRYGERDVRLKLDSPDHHVMVAQLSDRFGDYGTVGVLIMRRSEQGWVIEVLLVSCRVMGRGVGEGLLCYGIQHAKTDGDRVLRALYRKTAYNRAMHMLFVTHGFKRCGEQNGLTTFVFNQTTIPDYPSWSSVQLL